MDNGDYYSLLQIETTADQETIRSAYRRIAKIYHPDMNDSPKAADHFKRLSEAYEILSDEKKRKQYDTMKALSFGLPIEKLKDKYLDKARLQKLMRKVATGLAHAAGLFKNKEQKPGRDIKITKEITFFESYTGTEMSIEYKQPVPCDDCRGTGFSEIQPCLTCSGEGRLKTDALYGIKKQCPKCDGKGWKGETECDACVGTERTERDKKIKLKIPPGMQDERKLRVKGAGEGGRGEGGAGKFGDLIVRISVHPHPKMVRSGSDIRSVLKVPFHTAVMGGNVTVTLPLGEYNVNVPKLCWNGKLLRIIGSGFPDPKSEARGDCFFDMEIIPPERNDEKEYYLKYIENIQGPKDNLDDIFFEELERIFGRK